VTSPDILFGSLISFLYSSFFHSRLVRQLLFTGLSKDWIHRQIPRASRFFLFSVDFVVDFPLHAALCIVSRHQSMWSLSWRSLSCCPSICGVLQLMCRPGEWQPAVRPIPAEQERCRRPSRYLYADVANSAVPDASRLQLIMTDCQRQNDHFSAPCSSISHPAVLSDLSVKMFILRLKNSLLVGI